MSYDATACDVAWAAGLFEGEGCVFAKPDKGRLRIVASLDSCDFDVLDRFAEVIGVGRVYGPYEHAKGTKPYWKWKTTGPGNVEHVRDLLHRQLGARRLEAFRVALEAHAAQPRAWSRRQPEGQLAL